MRYLIIVSLVWAFSFPLIGHYLVGKNVENPIDSYFIVLIRFLLAFFVFLPFIRFGGVDSRLKLILCAIGAVQIGLMYVCYYQSFKYLQIHEVALFTIFTPFYVSLFYDLWGKEIRWRYLPGIALAVFGAYILKMGDVSDEFLIGFLWIQGANLCFGVGQSAYKRTMEYFQCFKQEQVFGYFYTGALLVGIVSFMCFGDIQASFPSFSQWLILVYLGVVASGLGYFLWNKGACRVDSGVLAIMNNMIIPLVILVNYVVWGVVIQNLVQFTCGSVLIILSLLWHYRILTKDKGLDSKATPLQKSIV